MYAPLKSPRPPVLLSYSPPVPIMPPLVSICLPTLNARAFLEARMASLLGQTLTDWELIVCDSHSEDGSWEFFDAFAGDPRVHLHHVPQDGLYAGWNECLRRATGEYVYIATADDTCQPDLLERLTALLDADRAVDLAVCRYGRIDEHGDELSDDFLSPDLDRFLGDWRDRLQRRSRYAELLIMLVLDCQWNTLPAVVFRRSLLERTGLFSTDLSSYADVAWRIKAVLQSDVLYCPDVLASWRWHAGQATAALPSNRAELVYRCRREVLKECVDLLPVRWRQDSDWLEALLFWRRQHYLMHFHLNRTALRKTPRSFLSGAARAAIKEPAYFLKRMARGLTWDAPEYGDPVGYLQDLMKTWNVEWPPKPL